jgi:hypothetical protein
LLDLKGFRGKRDDSVCLGGCSSLARSRFLPWYRILAFLRFGISLGGTSTAVLCDPSTGSVDVYTISPGGVMLASAAVSILGASVTQLDGTTVMTWTQTLSTAVSSDVTFAQSGTASVSYYVGENSTLPTQGPAVFHSASANLAPSTTTTSCNNVALGEDMRASWSIINGETLSVRVTLKRLQSWWVVYRLLCRR